MTARVALIGANGYGLAHRRVMATLPEALELVALCDLAPVRDEPDAPLPRHARIFTDYRELLATTTVDVVVVATPPHTHLEIATAAARAGADLLVEKPPVMSMADHRQLAEVLARAGRVCQVGFQDLGSTALAVLTGAISRGALGRIEAVSAFGGWQRPDAYYTRAPWAGRRSVDGRPSLDGVLANPFAHAVMLCLAIAGAAGSASDPIWPVEVELERYRARPIEVDDTAVLRVRLGQGPPIMVAVTLCADQEQNATVLVHTERGRALLEFRTDRLQLPGDTAPQQVSGRTLLLENLLAHRADPATDLLVPLARTAPFTALVEAVTAGPDPSTIGPSHVATHGAGPQRVVTVNGIGEVMRRAAGALALPSELGAPWATPPWRQTLTTASGVQQPGG